jgi:hypothetical protein
MGEGSGGGPPRLPKLGMDNNFLLGSSKKAVIDAAQGTRSYAEQPQALRSFVSKELWDGLPKGERLHLAGIYNTMQQYDLWQYVTKVNGVKEKPEAPTKVLGVPGEFHVHGSGGGFQFETSDHLKLYEGLMKANFGTDGASEGLLHGGQTSTRESTSGQVTHDVAAPNGLHVSIGPGNRFDAHIDQVSPTNGAQGGTTQMDVHRGWLHHRQEVHGDVIRDMHKAAADVISRKTGGIVDVPGVDMDLAGVRLGPQLEQGRVPMPEDRNNPAAPLMVDITLRGPK